MREKENVCVIACTHMQCVRVLAVWGALAQVGRMGVCVRENVCVCVCVCVYVYLARVCARSVGSSSIGRLTVCV